MFMDTINHTVTTVTGIGGVEILNQHPAGSNIELVVKLVAQIAIALGALLTIFKKPARNPQ